MAKRSNDDDDKDDRDVFGTLAEVAGGIILVLVWAVVAVALLRLIAVTAGC